MPLYATGKLFAAWDPRTMMQTNICWLMVGGGGLTLSRATLCSFTHVYVHVRNNSVKSRYYLESKRIMNDESLWWHVLLRPCATGSAYDSVVEGQKIIATSDNEVGAL